MKLKTLLIFGAILLTSLLALEIGCWLIFKSLKPVASYMQIYQKTLADRRSSAGIFEGDLLGLSRSAKLAHPVFGYTLNPRLTPKINSSGFRSEHEFPYVKKPGDFVVGLFGGSMAFLFGRYQEIQTAAGQSKLLSRLKAALPQKFSDRNLILLNFAVPGYKQPQQFAVATHFSESVDLAINLEGFNELDVPVGRSDFPVYFPTFSEIFYSSDPDQPLRVRKILKLVSQQDRFTQWLADSHWLAKSSLIFGAWNIYSRVSQSRLDRLQSELSNESSIAATSSKQKQDVKATYSEAVQIWEKYLRLQHETLKTAGALSLFFLQPNQYFKTTRNFSEEEAAIAFEPRRLGKDLPLGIKLMRERQKALAAEGLHVYDLTEAFDQIKEPVYEDNCCHVNDRGNEALEDALVQELTKAFR